MADEASPIEAAPAKLLPKARLAIPQMRLNEIYLVESSVNRGENVPQEFEGELEFGYGFKVEHDYDEGRKQLAAMVTFFAIGHHSSSDSKYQLFKIDSTFSVSYLVEDSSAVNAESLEAFAKLNGVYNAWPYWREYIQNCTARMGLPPVTAPLVTTEKIEEIFANRAKKIAEPASNPSEIVQAAAKPK